MREKSGAVSYTHLIHSVFDPAFAPYGKVLEGYDTAALLRTLREVTPVPEGVESVSYTHLDVYKRQVYALTKRGKHPKILLTYEIKLPKLYSRAARKRC